MRLAIHLKAKFPTLLDEVLPSPFLFLPYFCFLFSHSLLPPSPPLFPLPPSFFPFLQAFETVYDLTNSSGKLRQFLSKNEIMSLVQLKDDTLGEFLTFFRQFKLERGAFGDVWFCWGRVGVVEEVLGVEVGGFVREGGLFCFVFYFCFVLLFLF